MSTAVTAPQKKRDIRDLIQSDAVKQQLAMVLPKHITAERMARVTCTAILKTPKLAACQPESLLQALMLCSQAGLEPDGRNAHLIPYGDQVQVIFDWKGIVARARDNGVKNIAADVVCMNDSFKFNRTSDGLVFEHVIDYKAKERGSVYAVYCIWKDGEQFDGEVMTKAEVDAIRERSKAKNSGPWVTDYNEMAKKTVIRRASKKWPLDAEFAEAINSDADSLPQLNAASRPVFNTDKERDEAAALLLGNVPQPEPEPPKEAGNATANVPAPSNVAPPPPVAGSEQTEAPKAPEPPKEEKKKVSQRANRVLIQLRALMEKEKVDEPDFLAAMREKNLIGQTVIKLDDVFVETLEKAVTEWDDLSTKAKEIGFMK